MVAAFRARGEEAAAFGITSIQDMVLGVAPDMLARVADTLGLPYRLRLMPLPLTNPGGRVLAGWAALRRGGNALAHKSRGNACVVGRPVGLAEAAQYKGACAQAPRRTVAAI